MDITVASDADLEDVLTVEREAFGADEEAQLVAALLEDDSAEPRLSLLARVDGRAVGHVLFTAARLESIEVRGSADPLEAPPADADVSILAPLAVVPHHQRTGIGGALVRRGLEMLADAGIDLVFVLGHPEYYPRHGFEPAGRLGFDAPYPIPREHAEAWMVRELSQGAIERASGVVRVADALDEPELWRE